jgi:hypothetical protein
MNQGEDKQAEREHVPTDPDRVLFEALTSCNQEEDKGEQHPQTHISVGNLASLRPVLELAWAYEFSCSAFCQPWHARKDSSLSLRLPYGAIRRRREYPHHLIRVIGVPHRRAPNIPHQG